ncbi:MAG: hypothetical protein AAFU65_06570, partial [Pseudomonadota bacterium]
NTSSSNVREILIAATMHDFVVGPGITLRADTTGGRMRHQFNNGQVTVQGTIEAGLAARTVTAQGAPLRIEGNVNVSNDGRAVLDFFGSGGVFAASATAEVNTGELEFLGEFTIEGNINVTDGTLDLGGAGGAPWDNNGTIVLNNGTLELGGGFMAGDIGNITGTGTTIFDGTLDNTGQVVDLSGLAPGMLELAAPGRVVGGTVQGTTLTLNEFSSFTLEGVTLAADIDVERGGNLDVVDGLTLNGATITLGGDSNTSRLRFSGAAAAVSTLGGTGEVRFGGNTTSSNVREILVTSSQHGLTIGPNVTVGSSTAGGRVRHQLNNGPINVLGLIESNVASRIVSLQAAPLTVSGNVDVSGDGIASMAFQGAGGAFDASATGTINTGEIEFGGQFVIEGAITATDGTVDLGGTDGAAWDNNGTIVLINSTLEAGGGFDAAAIGNITGTGTSVINGVLDNTGQTADLSTLLPGTLELATPGRVVGGTLNGSTLSLQDFQNFTLEGVTLSADIDVLRGGNLDIEGGLTMDNSTISLTGDSNTSRLRVEGAAGGASTIGGTGQIQFGGTTTSSNVREVLVVTSTHSLTIGPNVSLQTDTTGGRVRHQSNNGGITLQGSVTSNVSGRTISLSAAPLIIEGPVNVSSDGIVLATFQGAGGEFAAAAVATINTGEFALAGDVTINGDISVTDGILDIGDGTTGMWVNNGNITMTNARVELGGEFDAAAVGNLTGTGTTVINGVFDNVGQTLDTGTLLPGSVELGTSGRINGGTVDGTSMTVAEFQTFIFDGVTLATDVTTGRGGTLEVQNGLTLASGNVILAGDSNTSRLRVTGPASATSTLGGTGEVRFDGATTSSNVREILVASSQHNLVIGSGVTVRTSTTGGRIRNQSNNASITLDGTVVSDIASRIISVFGTVANPVQVNGTLDIGAGATIDLDDYVLNGSAVVNIDIGGTATAQFGRLTSNDDATLGGTLNVALVNGFVPSPGDAFAVATYVNRAGTFGTENTAGLNLAYNAANITLTAP